MVADGSFDGETLGAGLRAARALGESRNYRGAVEVLRRLLGQHPDNAEAHYLLGLYFHNLGRHADAVAECRAAVALAPTDAIAHRLLGVALGAYPSKKGEGVDHLRQAVTLAPQDGFNHYFLARALAGLPRPREALTSFLEACDRAPGEPLVLAGTAEFLFATYRVRKARDFASRALAAGPEDLSALTAQARSRLVDGCAADARDLARAAVTLHATHKPAIEVLVEAEMCRNPVYALWSRLKGWCRGGRWRAAVLMLVWFQLLAAVVMTTAGLFPDDAAPAVLAFVSCLAVAQVPNMVYRRRVAGALRPVKLDRRF